MNEFCVLYHATMGLMLFCFTDRLNWLAIYRDCLMLIFCDQRVTIVLRSHQSETVSEGDKPLTAHIVLDLNHAQMNRGYNPDVCFSSAEVLTLEPSCLCEKGFFIKGARTWQSSHHPLCSVGFETDRICVCPVYISHKKITATQTCSGPV